VESPVAASPGLPSAKRGAGTLVGTDITVTYEGVHALDGVTIEIGENELVGLIGPNGAGKTTMINVLSGLVRPSSGQLTLDGERLTNAPSWKLARRGVARSFQGTRLFRGLTVEENIEAAALGTGSSRSEARELARSLLARARMEGVADNSAAGLSGGDQQRVGVLRALAAEPRYVLLDEPAAGLNELEGEQFVELIRTVRDERGCGILIVDHDMSVIMALCERIQVLNFGHSIAMGTRDEVRRDPVVIEAYLGTGNVRTDPPC